MAEDVKNAVGKVARVLRLAKNRANTQLGKVKERAQEVTGRFSAGSSGGSSGGYSPDRVPGASAAPSAPVFLERPARKAASEEESKVERLVALGFSAAAARQGLRACSGRLDEAGLWLLDERNADEIFAAEVAAEAALPLVPGGIARVSGLRGASALNGSVVVLQKWDKDSERWVVSMPDGSLKSMRSRNLDALPSEAAPRSAPSQTSAPPPEADELAGRSAVPGRGVSLDLEELRGVAKGMLASHDQPVEDEVISALTAEDLLELIENLNLVDVEKAASSKESKADPISVPQTVATEDTDDPACIPKEQVSGTPWSSAMEGSPMQNTQENDIQEKQMRLEETEDRLNLLAEEQQRRAAELEAREAALREAEEHLAKRRAEAETLAQQAKEAPPVRIPFVQQRPEDESPASPGCSSLEADLRQQQEELQRLRDEVKAAAQELEERQKAAKQSAEEREIRLLEQESAQMHEAEKLKDEEARLSMQRKSLGMLQQAILRGASVTSSDGLVELSMADDGDLDAEVAPKTPEKAKSASSPRAEAQTSSSPDIPVYTPAKDQTTEEKVEDQKDEDDDEVWDLDWSAVGSPKDECESPGAAEK